MNETPKGNRTHIALVGRTNVGKSSLLNLISGQDVAITSNVPGTTTDVVEKTMELLPLGPVVFLDTAGLDDKTDLAELRRKKTSQALKRADAVILVAEAGVWTEDEERIVQETEMAMIPLVIAVNKIDLGSPDPNYLAIIGEKTPRLLSVAATNGKGREACSHHPLADDIGRVKIPRWLRQYVGGEIQTEITAGKDYPRDLRPYRLIVHCGACMFTRREMLRRLKEAREQQVPITNYGLAISVTQGVIERTLQPFPAALAAYERELAAPASNINGMRAQ